MSEARPIHRLPRGGAAQSPGFAAVLSGLLPGLGQAYDRRWARAAVLLLLPIAGLSIVGAFLFVAEPLTTLVVRNAGAVAFGILGTLLFYHLTVVADAFIGRRGGDEWRGREISDYVLFVLVAAAVVAGYGVAYRESSTWASLLSSVFQTPGEVRLPGSEAAAPEWNGRERLNVLLLGLDVREGSSETNNTDTIMVLSLDPLNNTGTILSIPRDTFVTVRGVMEDKINAAYAYGGADLARRAVSTLLGIPIHSYALVDFPAFERMVNGVGGVLVDVERPLRDDAYPTANFGIERFAIGAGPQLMSGEQALRYARSRHDSNDFSRSVRQQDVIAGFRQRVVQGGIGRLPAIVDEAGSVVRTNFDPGDVLPLAGSGLAIPDGGLRSEQLLPCGIGADHCELTEQNDPNGYYLFPRAADIADLVAQLFYDPRIRADGANVEVRATGASNATARSVADGLTARAFGVSATTSGANARSAVVLRNNAQRYTAERLAAQMGVQVVAADAAETSTADIVVRVGADFRDFVATGLETAS